MQLTNSATRYGAISKLLHWSVFVLMLYQFIGANLMTRLARDEALLSVAQGGWYNGHKSIGLVLLGLALLRLLWRRVGGLPDWDEALSPAERAISHRNETLLFACLFLMPLTGYVFVMAGGYGVSLFGVWDLANPLGTHEYLASLGRIAHVVLAYATVVVLAWHVGLGVKKHVFERTGFLRRMLP